MDTLVIYTISVRENQEGRLYPTEEEDREYEKVLNELKELLVGKGKVVFRSDYRIV